MTSWEILTAAVAWGLQFAIVLGVAFASRWILRFCLKREAARPHVWIVAGIWLVGLVASNAYWGYTGWFQSRFNYQLISLSDKAWEEAKQVAKSKGEIVPPDPPLTIKLLPPQNWAQPGPILIAEYSDRYQKSYEHLASQSVAPNIKSGVLEWFLLFLWFGCALGVAGYCLAVLRKSSGWLKSSMLALSVALVQCFAVGIPTFILTQFAHVALGGSIPL